AVRLDLPVAWLEGAPPGIARAAVASLETTLRIELARTTLERDDFMGAAAGDAVVFEGVSPPDAGRRWPSVLSVGARRARGELLASGDLRPDGPFVLSPQEPGANMNGEDDAAGGDTPASGRDTVETAAVLAAAPVDVVAELGRIALRGDELMGLVRGAVLP